MRVCVCGNLGRGNVAGRPQLDGFGHPAYASTDPRFYDETAPSLRELGIGSGNSSMLGAGTAFSFLRRQGAWGCLGNLGQVKHGAHTTLAMQGS